MASFATSSNAQHRVRLAMVHFANHPEQRDRLRNEPEILPIAVEKIIRFYSPLLALGRRVGKDTTLGGRELKAGQQLAVVWAAAGHDTTYLPDADQFVLDRPLATRSLRRPGRPARRHRGRVPRGHLKVTAIIVGNVARSSAHRLLSVLVEHGYIDRQDCRYRLGRAVFELGCGSATTGGSGTTR